MEHFCTGTYQFVRVFFTSNLETFFIQFRIGVAWSSEDLHEYIWATRARTMRRRCQWRLTVDDWTHQVGQYPRAHIPFHIIWWCRCRVGHPGLCAFSARTPQGYCFTASAVPSRLEGSISFEQHATRHADNWIFSVACCLRHDNAPEMCVL